MPAGTDLPPPERPIAPWDTQTIIYTSGTTGPSKGVLSSYVQLHASAEASFHYATAEDRCMVNLPLFHVGGTGPVYAMLIKGGSVAIVDAFDTGSFLRVVRETGTTTAIVLAGTLSSFGLPLEGVAVILGVDELMDMARTTVNVLGNCLASAVVGRWEGELGPLGAPSQSAPALARGAVEPVQRTGT